MISYAKTLNKYQATKIFHPYSCHFRIMLYTSSYHNTSVQQMTQTHYWPDILKSLCIHSFFHLSQISRVTMKYSWIECF